MENQNTGNLGNTDGKRDVHVTVKGSSGKAAGDMAKIWVVCPQDQVVIGPFDVYTGETLIVPIDEREWGVVIKAEKDVIVDVWIEETQPFTY